MRWTSTAATFFSRLVGCLLLGLLLTARPGLAQSTQGEVADSTELHALHDFYTSTNGDQWYNRTNWPTTPAGWASATLADVATWAGMSVANGDVTSLDFFGNGIGGHLLPSIGLLRGLRTLHIERSIYCCPDAPTLGGTLPKELGQLHHLQTLSLNFLDVTGQIPKELGQLTELRTLEFGTTSVSGPIPPELGNLSQLTRLVLTNWYRAFVVPQLHPTALTGGLPPELGKLHNLTFLSIGDNPLGGPLPKELSQLTNLQYFAVDESHLSGTVPLELLSLPQLTTIILGAPIAGYSDPNTFTTLPNPDLIPNLANRQLILERNQFGFHTLEPYFTGPGQMRSAAGSTYLPQTQPVLVTDTLQVLAQQPAQFDVHRDSVLVAPHSHYQWQRQVAGQWVDMPTQTQELLRWSQVMPADAGFYRCVATNDWVTGLTLYSRPHYLDIPPYAPLARNLPDDSNPPTRPLQAPPAQADATAAALAPDMNYVRVWTPRQALTQAASGPTRPAGVRREQWAGVTGGIAAIPVTTTPQAVQQLPSLEATTTTFFQYGARLRAWLTPPQTGSYTFWISATNAGALWLSTDQDPAHAVKLDSCTQFTSGPQDYQRYPAQQSTPVTLTAGQHYYLEVRHQHDYGPGYVSVTWQLPDGSQYGQPIAGQYLQPYEDGAPGPDAVTWSVEQAAMSTQYLDGLGRPVQTVQWQASPGKHDLVQPQAYDGLGREPRQFLPYAADSTDGGYRPRALTEQGQYYASLPPTGPPSPQDLTLGVARTGVAFSETLFEASPLNRVVAQAAPGEAWQLTGGHHQERAERPNVFADSLLRFTPGYGPTDLDPHCQGSYAPGELWGVVTRDEHGYWAAEWKDKLGQVVAKQVQTQAPGQGTGAARRWLRTFYVYDDFQRLRFVLQPEASRRQLAAVGALAPAPPPTGVRWEQWANVPGTSIADIPLSQAPTSVQTLPQLELVSSDFHYGTRLRAWLLPPQDGPYTFYLSGNDAAELYLSTDSDPTHKVRLATSSQFQSGPRDYQRWPEQQSAQVSLRADRVYYLEVLQKQEWGEAYASVSWQLPDGTPARLPIAGAYLSPYDPALPPPPAPGSVPLPAAALPPAASPYLFHYRYDGRGRQIAKQVPGTDGETLVVYDQLDRPVLSQDASQRTRREWSWTKYDALGRIILSGLTTRQDTAGQVSLQNLATADTATAHQYEQRTADKATFAQFYTTSQSFPQLGQNGFGSGQVLSASYYDDYDFDNNGQADVAYDTAADAAFPSGQAPVADALRTQGLPTRTSTRVLGVAENDPSQAAWLTTTTFYDERTRPVQVQSTNARKGTDLVTTQLDFTGKVVQSVARHQGPGLASPLQVAEFFTYDHSNRLLSSRQQLPGEARPALLDSVQYNELGQVTRKSLATGRLRQDVDYAYNIRGWLTSLNDPYSPNPTQHDLFNLSLHYERGFTQGYEQYNGNLTGQTWRGRDGVQRAYGYVYDPLNRLLQGDFVARAGGSTGTLASATAWNQERDNYRLSFVSYDDNGNILTLRRQGLLKSATHATAKQYGAVDNLSYAYQGNRLQAVDDAVTGNQLPRPTGYNGAPTSLAGDFQEQGVKLAQEYLYDANGNLTQDKNKGITGILYNHLNLPRQIHFGQVGDSVVFRYTAAGQKVAKLVYQTGKPLTRTDYLGPYQYEQDSLKFFPHAEGRVLRFVSYDAAHQPTVSYQREFTIKDHLGNLRLAYRAGQVRTLLATLEQDDNTKKRETQQFDSLSVSAPVAQATSLAHSGAYAARLNAGGSTPQPLGPLTQVGVQQGDTLTVTAFGYYAQPVQHGFLFSLGSFLAGLFHPAQTPPPGFEASRRKDLPLLQVGVGAGLASVPQLSGGVPKGYLRVLVFNRDSALVSQQTQQLSQAANGGYEPLRTQLVLPQDGYVSAYVGNESDVDVLFDDVSVEHRPGLQVQETQYDPAGLELAGLVAPSPGIKGLNNYRFNGKEFQPDLGLNWNHQDWRFLDPTTLHWNGVDPEVESGQESWSPYSFGYDNAVRYADANGREPDGGGPPTKPKPFQFNYIYQNSGGTHVYRGTVTNGNVSYTLSHIKGSEKNLANISNKSAGVIATSMAKANVNTVHVTSTHRTPRQDAAAMYTNASKPNGVADGHRLYGHYGDKIVDTYAAARGAGLNREQTIDRMTATIVQLGPTNVSHHAFDPAVLNVIDMSNSALGAQATGFNAALLANPEIPKMFSPYTLGHRDPAFHVEIPPTPSSTSTPTPMK